MRKKAPQSLVVWSRFRRCLIGLPPMSLFLSVMHNNFHWTQHFCKSRSLEELSQLDADCEHVIVSGSEAAQGKQAVPLACGSSCWTSVQPSCVQRDNGDHRTPDWKHNTEFSSLHSRFAVFTLILITWDLDPCFHCSKLWRSCSAEGEGQTPHELLFPLDAEIKSRLWNATFVSCQRISCKIPGRALNDSSLHGQTGRGLDTAKHE